MSASEHSDFIPYPTNRVVGTIADSGNARAAIEALLAGGIDERDIDILHGDQDLNRLDVTGEEHGFLARFQRTLIRTAGSAEEYQHLIQHVDDVRSGRYVIMVLAREHGKRDRVAEILHAHHAQSVGFYGRWAWQAV